MTGVLRRGELEAVKTWVQLSLKTPRYIFPKMPRSANYIAERGNQKNTSFLIFSLYPIFISRNARREVPASCGPND
jgi:hypothetical protein